MIRAVHGMSAYHISLLGLIETQDDVISIKFDTGASYTVISLNTLLGTDDAKKLKQFSETIPSSKFRRIFTSASGNDMKGVLCHAKDIILSGCKIKDFYYYLIIFDEKSEKDRERRLALLGDDFISCCSFNHSIGGDILITSFNTDKYMEHAEYAYIDILETDELRELYIDVMEDTEDTANLQILDSFGNDLTDDGIIKNLFTYKDDEG